MQGFLSDSEKSSYDVALYGVFATFMRPFSLYLDAQTAVVNTNPSFAGMFGDTSQNVTTTLVTPQSYIISGCIRYGNDQHWDYIEPGSRGNYQQNKIRESEGVVNIKVDTTGYNLLVGCQQVILDGYTFTLNSTPRPHGLVGAPNRWTFKLLREDPS